MLPELRVQNVESMFCADADVIERSGDQVVLTVELRPLNDNLVDAGCTGAAEDRCFQLGLFAGAVQLGEQRVQAEEGAVRRLELDGVREADALLLRVVGLVARQSRAERGVQLSERCGRTTCSVTGAECLEVIRGARGPVSVQTIHPTHSARSIVNDSALRVGRRQENAELAISKSIADQARCPG